ncbi:hypothetical protein COU38_00590 [Candidatus Micrarchaeota archaeon CG10_big_fil_rev_8_21_14_0_10_54_18]|nr:MAG: hypothetical protein COU38_00590 [Candidatus Micrarchaeota archaeon CG10_big_fil_rev_8_21_14_0_10_54_18]
MPKPKNKIDLRRKKEEIIALLSNLRFVEKHPNRVITVMSDTEKHQEATNLLLKELLRDDALGRELRARIGASALQNFVFQKETENLDKYADFVTAAGKAKVEEEKFRELEADEAGEALRNPKHKSHFLAKREFVERKR